MFSRLINRFFQKNKKNNFTELLGLDPQLTQEKIKELIRKDPYVIGRIPIAWQTDELADIAMAGRADAFFYLSKHLKNEERAINLVSRDSGGFVRLLVDPDCKELSFFNIGKVAVDVLPEYAKYFRKEHLTQELIVHLAKKRPGALINIHYELWSQELALAAVRTNPWCYAFITGKVLNAQEIISVVIGSRELDLIFKIPKVLLSDENLLAVLSVTGRYASKAFGNLHREQIIPPHIWKKALEANPLLTEQFLGTT